MLAERYFEDPRESPYEKNKFVSEKQQLAALQKELEALIHGRQLDNPNLLLGSVLLRYGEIRYPDVYLKLVSII